MPCSKKKFYKLAELAERWGKDEDELLHLASGGDLPLSVWYKGYFTTNSVNDDGEHLQGQGHHQGFLLLGRKDVCELLLAGDEVNVGGLFDIDGQYVRFGIIYGNAEYQRFSRSDFVVLADIVDGMEAEDPDLLVGGVSVRVRNGFLGKPVSLRAERTDLHVIGGMLELLLGKHNVVSFKSKAEIITALIERCQGLPGISKRTLEDRFAKAERAINSPE